MFLSTVCRIKNLKWIPVFLALLFPAQESTAVSILESFDSTAMSGVYTVVNDSGNELHAFAVGHNTATDSSVDLFTYPELNGKWGTFLVTQEEWNNNQVFSDHNWNAPILTATWNSYFGAGFTQAIVYTTFIIGNGIAAGVTQSGFTFEAPTASSPFVIFTSDSTGTSVITGEATLEGEEDVVPEPATLMSAVVGLAMFRRLRTRHNKGDLS